MIFPRYSTDSSATADIRDGSGGVFLFAFNRLLGTRIPSTASEKVARPPLAGISPISMRISIRNVTSNRTRNFSYAARGDTARETFRNPRGILASVVSGPPLARLA